MTDQVTPAPGSVENTTDLKTMRAEMTGRSRQGLLGPFAKNPIERRPPLSSAEDFGNPPSAIFPPATNSGDEDSPEHDIGPKCDDDPSQIPFHANDAAPSGRNGASEQTRKGSEDTVVEVDTTFLYSNPLLRRARLLSWWMRSTGGLSFLSPRWGTISEDKHSKRHGTQQQVFRAPKDLSGAQGTNEKTSLTKNNSDVPEWVNSLPPTEEQVDASGEQPCATEWSDKAQYDAAVPEAKAHHESGMNKPDGEAVAVSLSNPSNDLTSQATGNPNEHLSPSTDSTAARALSASQTEADPDSSSAWSLDNVQELITSREKIVRGILSGRGPGRFETLTPRRHLTTKEGTPGEVLCEILSDFRKAEATIPDLELSLTSFIDQLSSWKGGLSHHEHLAVRELCDLTKAFNGLRVADKSYEELFGTKWMEASGIQGCSTDVTRAIQEDARAPIDLTKDGRIQDIAKFLLDPDGPGFWGRRLREFIDARSHRADARRVLNTVYQRDNARTKFTKSHCTATSVSKPNPGSGQLQRLPPWRPSLFSADANRLRQVGQHWTVDREVINVLNTSRAAGHLITALEAVEAAPEGSPISVDCAEQFADSTGFFKRNDWLGIYISSAGDLKSVREKQITSLEEGLTEAKRKHMSVWSSALQAASARLYDEKSNERKQQGLKRIKEHLDAYPPELTLTQRDSKAGDKPAYTWNEDEDLIAEHLARTALEWNFERGGSFTLDLLKQDDLSRGPLEKVRQELIDIEQGVIKLGQMRTSRQERATNLSTELHSTITPAKKKSTTTAPAKGGATEAKSVVGSKWEPDDNERRILVPIRDAKDRVDQVLDDVKRLDSVFDSNLATLRKQLEKHEATQSNQEMTRTKSQILSLLDTWTTYSKYDRSRDGLQDLDESAHDIWTDFFSNSKSAFADRRALIPEVQDLVKQSYADVSTLCDRELDKALSVPFDKAKDVINKEEQATLGRFENGPPDVPNKVLWTSAYSKLHRAAAAARARSQASETTKTSQHHQAISTRGVAESSSPLTQSGASESIKASKSSTVPSSAGTSDVSTSTLTGSNLST